MATSTLAETVVDLDAYRGNLGRLRELVGTPVMAVVKADAYGHGMIEIARAAREAGAEWLGVATLDEAAALRDSGDQGPLLCWLAAKDDDLSRAVAGDIEVTAYTIDELDRIADAGARCQLKVDTGLSRGGATMADWQALVEHAVRRDVEVTGIWSHFACSDEPEHPANDAQEAAYREALDVATRAGLRPAWRHLANSAAALLRPSSRFDLVRLGIATYGLNPAPDALDASAWAGIGVRPVMTATAQVALTKEIPAGAGVSYGHTFVAERPMRVALVPVGYGDGVPRHASNTAEVQIGGRRCRILGRVCMDQFVVDVGDADVRIGDRVVLFGPGDAGEPSATDWARAAGTISYEIVTRYRGREVRRFEGSSDGSA